MTSPAQGAEFDTRAELSAIESARQAAVDNTQRPGWLIVAYAVTIGAAFGFWQLRTPMGWIVGSILFVLGIVGFLIINARLKRRRGLLLKFMGGSVLRSIAMVAVMFFILQIQPADSWQPWFALGVGVAFAAMGYINLRWDDADTARKLANGDFHPNDLMT